MPANQKKLVSIFSAIFLAGSFAIATLPAPAIESNCQKCMAEATKLLSTGDAVKASELLKAQSAECADNAAFQTLLATIYLRLSNLAGAQSAGLKAIEHAPNSTAAHFQYALALKGLGKKEAAIVEFDKVVDLDPSNWESWASLADLYKELHQDDKAKQCEYKAATLAAPTLDARNNVFRNLVRQGNLTKAEDEFSKSINANEHNPVVLQQLAKQALVFNFWNEAIVAASEVLKTFPDAQDALLSKATGEYFLHKYLDCQNTLNSVLKTSPENSEAKILSALCFLDLGESTKAAEILESANAPKQNSPLSQLAVGKWHQARGDLKAAETSYGAISDDMLSQEAQLALSRVYAKQGKVDDAEEKAAFNVTSQISLARSLAAQAEAICQQDSKTKSLDKARELVSKALTIAEDEPSSLLAMSKIDLAYGKDEDAKTLANKVIQMVPGTSDAYLVLAKIESQKGNTKQAELLLDKVLALANDDPDASLMLGTIYLRDGNTKQALDALKAALAGRQESAEICYVLAKALEQDGDINASLKYYKQSLSLGLVGTENAEASQAIKRLTGNSQEQMR
ncbi:MAG: tetratricopeptide repeat protein [Candidatus Obscuribacterales bacterium]|nr:tetratricopeptide repeat protein [Candidatus Obscuribacterales bacterium]